MSRFIKENLVRSALHQTVAVSRHDFKLHIILTFFLLQFSFPIPYTFIYINIKKKVPIGNLFLYTRGQVYEVPSLSVCNSFSTLN